MEIDVRGSMSHRWEESRRKCADFTIRSTDATMEITAISPTAMRTNLFAPTELNVSRNIMRNALLNTKRRKFQWKGTNRERKSL